MKRVAISLRGPEVRIAIGVLAAVLTVVACGASGIAHEIWSALLIMGFDPDRAVLLRALLVGAGAAAASALASGRVGMATLLGFLGSAALFSTTFVTETQSALRSTGVAGSFDLGGWLITLLALALSGMVSARLGATLAMDARPAIVDAVRAVGSIAAWLVARLTLALGGLISGQAGETLVIGVRPTVAGTLLAVGSKLDRHRVQRRAVGRTAVVAVAGMLLVVGGPAFGDLVNYSPDALMLRGRPPLVGLGGVVSVANGSGGPWLAWRPSGNGSVVTSSLPAPWSGGSTTIALAIYTPPGYDPTEPRRYPTLYEAPTPFQVWDGATGVKDALDTLIDSGAIPPTIVVFIDSGDGPFLDSECADSVDGREWFDRYVSQTVVPWVDSTYRTITKPAARAIMGNSQGGYCAAILTLRHPDIFGTSISFSGYFHAGIIGSNSAWPFNGDQTALDAASPDIVVGQLAPSVRANLYFIVVSDPNQPLYGPQAASFDQLLAANGYPHLAMSAEIGHGWVEVREDFPTVLETWAARLVATGVF